MEYILGIGTMVLFGMKAGRNEKLKIMPKAVNPREMKPETSA
jgi:hypothetical protein